MDTHELTMNGGPQARPRRVTEAELRLPRREEIRLPHVNLEPARSVAEQVLLTGIGATVLLARGVAKAVRTANEAGSKAAEQPGPVTKALLSLVRGQGESATPPVAGPAVSVPIMPIDNYQARPVTEILARLPELSDEQLRTVRTYEMDHLARTEVLEAINSRLAQA
ncbi:MAG: hypothetical protein ACYC5M_10565 [Anaerolineae bacterium]